MSELDTLLCLAFGVNADRIDTHLSTVVFVDGAAYKWKKSVKLPFVDQSTLELRRQLCHLEVELNRRFSGTGDSLYKGVVGLTSKGVLVLDDGDDSVVEVGVKMAAFDQASQGDNALQSGVLTAELVERFGQRLFKSYETAPVTQLQGSPQQDQLDNLDYLDQVPQADTATLQRLRRHLEAENERLAPLLQQRQAEGFVRECHGDLHLSNTVLLEGELVAFDCLEFNRSLRTIDSLCDVAFFVMDLDSRRRSDLAMTFFSAYLEYSGDFASLPLHNYYLLYRTLVRAKVSAISHNWSKMELHLQLALDYVHRSEAPRLIIMHGVSGSGKSFVAKHLVPALQACRIRSDVVRKRLFNLAPLDKSSDSLVGAGIYSASASEKVQRRVLDIVGMALDERLSVIVDATNTKRALRDAYRALAAERKVPLTLVSCRAERQVLEERVQVRKLVGNDPSEASVAVLQAQLERAEPIEEDEHALVLDTSRGLTVADINDFAKQIIED